MDKKQLKKQEIIKKSIGIMFEKGYHGTGVKELADAAGIPKGSIYNYFENKEDYLREALLYYYKNDSHEQFELLGDKNVEPLDRIRNFYKFMIDSFDECDFKNGCFVGKITQEVSGSSDIIKEVTNNIQKEIIKMISDNLDEAKEKNLINKEISSDSLAEFIFSSWQGCLLRLKASRDKSTLDNFYGILDKVLLK